MDRQTDRQTDWPEYITSFGGGKIAIVADSCIYIFYIYIS